MIKLAPSILSASAGLLLAAQPALASPEIDAMFTSPDARLNANKQIVHGLFRDMVQCGKWEFADKYLTERYIQHNPLVGSGRAEVVAFFEKLGLPRREQCDTLDVPVAAVIAEGDLVTVLMPVRYEVPGKPGEVYSTTWFDAWRIKDGKADEHWDGQKLCPGLAPIDCMKQAFAEAR